MERPAFQIPPPRPPCFECGNEAEGTYAGRPVCNECGTRLDGERRERQRQTRAEENQRNRDAQLGSLASRHPRMWRWTFDTYPDDKYTTTALEQIRVWLADVDDRWSNALIYGPVGTGKTGLAWAAMRQWLDDMPFDDVDFVNVRDLLAAAKRSYGDAAAPDPLEGLDALSLLVLDDLGAERPTEWALDTIATLIEVRYQRERHTIVTSNYSPAQLVTRLRPRGATDDIIGQRIVSRLVESCMTIHLDGPDRRVSQEKAA